MSRTFRVLRRGTQLNLTSASNLSGFRRYLGVALLSASLLALQIVYTRIFSITIWHHFTYLIIGLALLGGGAGGTFLAIKQWNEDKLAARLGGITIIYSISILFSLLIISFVGFDPLRRSEMFFTLFGLVLYFIALFFMFSLGGICISGVFRLWSNNAHKLYFSDLVGAGIGILVIVWIIQAIGGPNAIVLMAIIALIAGLLLAGYIASHWRWIFGILGSMEILLFFIVVFNNPITLPIPESKELGWALKNFGFKQPEYTRWNHVARVDVLPEIVVKEPMIVGGVSRHYIESKTLEEKEYPLKLVTLDGTSMTGIYKFNGNIKDFEFLNHAIIGAPYQLLISNPDTLNIGIGGGIDILLARLNGASSITAIELNSDVVHLLYGPYREYSGNLVDDPSTKVIVAEGRSFLERDDRQYDIIQGIGLDNLAALSGGAYVLAESYLYTVDAMQQVLDRLSPNGVFAWTRSAGEPPRETLRLTALAAKALRQRGVENPASHIAIVEDINFDSATLLVSNRPFRQESMANLRRWANENRFEILHDPFVNTDTIYADYLYSPFPDMFENEYQFNIAPVTDDNPFFYNYYKWSNFRLDRVYSGRAGQQFPIGNLILITMMGLATLAALLFIILPLWFNQRSGLKSIKVLQTLMYFSALGAAYIFIEVILIQRFTLFIGYPTKAITTTIFGLLVFSGIGSYFSPRICTSNNRLRLVIAILVGLVVLYAVGLKPFLSSMLNIDDSIRSLIAILIIAPLALLMGMPFPTGIRQLGYQMQAIIPWAWGMNGVFSVVGSVLVIIVSMASSFTMASIVGALLYALAGYTAGYLRFHEAT